MDETYLAERLAALGHLTRLRVVRELLAAPDGLPAGKLAAKLRIRQNSLSSHLATLARNGLIAGARDGREVVYSARSESLSVLLQDMRGLLSPSSGKAE
jgi:ArsR family transcriptional regulator, arsenate/arsenite/antimonite-responsive transcriptional repressor